MSEVSLRAAEKLLKKAGCKRISVEACKELQKVLEKKAVDLGKIAWKLTKHAKRRTVLADDVKLASETML
ncbi:MAG: NFYB/HAP3 family transcription factor subunit [Nanoarchaeota archaeon]|nr:NFYB/HAP3 family transcription factor subunit [Nanoarchaeota archaeon]